jgi:replicative DNA helicase
MNEQNKKQRKKPSIDLSTMVYGKVPPQAKELEEAVLGACLLESKAFELVSSIIGPEAFYVDANKRVFKACIDLRAKNQPIDELTVVQELLRSEELDIVGGPFAITNLTKKVVSTANVETHAKIVLQKFMQREMIRICGEAIGEAYEDSTDVFDLIDVTEGRISELAVSKTTKPYESWQNVIAKTMVQIETTRHTKETITGVPSGIPKLDAITQGWQNENLIIIAARPSVGKSAIAANIAVNAAMDKTKSTGVGVFSLEMSNVQWAYRIISGQSQTSLWDIKRGEVNDQQMRHIENVAYKQMQNVKLFFDDSSSLDIYQLKNKARKMVLEDGCGLIIVDYLQLMNGLRGKNDNREQEISNISRNLKQLAKELKVPIIALSQLSRAVETRSTKGGGSKIPQLSDLRESGAIEQDADMVIFLVPVEDEEVNNDASLKDSILIKIAKNRDGSLELIPVKFVKDKQKIMTEEEYRTYENNMVTFRPGNWKPVPKDFSEPDKEEGGKFFIQKGSKMSSGEFDEGFDEQPF